MRFCFISDTHNYHDALTIPECDILVHCGDWTGLGRYSEVTAFATWLNKQPAKHIVIIPGNHEKVFEAELLGSIGIPGSRSWITNACPKAHVLIDESIVLEGYRIYGSPWSPFFFDWAWNAGRTITEAAHTGKPFIGDIWSKIPENTQILITHGPGYGKLDKLKPRNGITELAGCVELQKRIEQLPDLKIHAFGHLHYQGGQIEVDGNVTYINAAICDDKYRAHDSRKIVIDLP
jgi:predicted phosphodiesterase